MHFSSATFSAALLMATIPSADAFVSNGSVRNHNNSVRSLSTLTAAESELDLGMTPELKKVTDAFASIQQEQVRYMHDDETSSSDDGATDDEAAADGDAQGPKYTAITQALQALKPELITLVDTSDLNGSAEGKETHFELSIVASAFEGLNVIKRQQLIFLILFDLMSEIKGLQIASMFTPEEVEQRS